MKPPAGAGAVLVTGFGVCVPAPERASQKVYCLFCDSDSHRRPPRAPCPTAVHYSQTWTAGILQRQDSSLLAPASPASVIPGSSALGRPRCTGILKPPKLRGQPGPSSAQRLPGRKGVPLLRLECLAAVCPTLGREWGRAWPEACAVSRLCSVSDRPGQMPPVPHGVTEWAARGGLSQRWPAPRVCSARQQRTEFGQRPRCRSGSGDAVSCLFFTQRVVSSLTVPVPCEEAGSTGNARGRGAGRR